MQLQPQTIDTPGTAHDHASFDSGLRASEILLAEHLAAVVRVYGSNGLGVIDLPALGPESLVPAQLRVAAVLYWCRELEEAGVLPFVEALAEGVVSGTLLLPIGQSAQRLMRFWRTAEHRFTAPERLALFERILDSGNGGGFNTQFAHLVEALTQIGRERRDRGILHLQVRAGQLAQDLGAQLSSRAVGIAGFAARDIVNQIRQSLAVLQDAELANALGGGSPWLILSRWGPRQLGRQLAVSRHVARAEHGVEILRWIADAAPDVVGAGRRIGRDHPIVRAAEAWRGTLGGEP